LPIYRTIDPHYSAAECNLRAKTHQPTGNGTKGRSELTRDEEDAGLELLEEHHSLAHEAPSEQDQHRPGGDGGPAQTNVRFGSK